jgi:Co/Zn/Cd efflux system component
MSHTATCALDPQHHDHDSEHSHEHSHGLVDRSIMRSRAGLRAVAFTLGILGVTAIVQAAIYGVVLTAGVVAIGVPIADPIMGLVITGLILHITWESWQTVRSA